MKKTVSTVVVPAVILFCSFLTGCATARHRVPEAGQLSPPFGASPVLKMGYQFSSGYELEAGQGRTNHPQSIRQELEKELVDVLKESGCFAAVSPGQGGGININVDLLNYGNGNGKALLAFAYLSGFTLCVIPCWATDNYQVTAKVTAPDGRHGEYVLDDAVTAVFWLPAIVAMPFCSPAKVPGDVRRNMYRNLMLKLKQDGWLEPAKKG